MTTSLSEVISYLNFDGSIGIGAQHETIKTLLQEFGSISVTVTMDQNISLIIEFSNDGINFDYKSANSLAAGSSTITSVILGKWCKIRAVNSSRFVANVRFYTYAQVLPISVQAQIESEGNALPSVNIDNLTGTLYNDLRVGLKRPITTIDWTYYQAPAGVISGPDREIVQLNGGGANFALSPATIVNNTLTLSNIYTEALGAYHYVYGPPVIMTAANPLYINMTCGFFTNGYISTGVSFDEMLCGVGYVDDSVGSIIDGFFVGYPKTPVPPNPITDEFSMVFYLDGVEDSIPKSQWYYDRLDGDGPSAIVLDPSKLNTWRIRVSIGSSIYLDFHHPFDNTWIECHRIQAENKFTTNLIKNPSLGFLTYTERTTASVGNFLIPNGCGPTCSQATVGTEVGEADFAKLQSYCHLGAVASPALTQTEVVSFRNGLLFNGIDNRCLVIPTFLSASSVGLLQPQGIKLIKNATFVAPVWTPKDVVNDPVETSSGFMTVGSGYEVGGLLVSPNSTGTLNLDTVDIKLSRGETLSITTRGLDAATMYALLNYNILA